MVLFAYCPALPSFNVFAAVVVGIWFRSTGLKLEEVTNDMKTGDPAGFTAVDVLALGSFGHAVGIGIVLGLKGIGKI